MKETDHQNAAYKAELKALARDQKKAERDVIQIQKKLEREINSMNRAAANQIHRAKRSSVRIAKRVDILMGRLA